MESLQYIVSFLQRHSSLTSNEITRYLSSSPRLLDLYELMVNKDLSEPQLIKLLYGDDKHKRSFQELARRLKNKLEDLAVYTCTKLAEHGEVQLAYFQAQKHYSLARTTRTYSYNKLSVELAKKGLAIANHYELTDLGVIISKMLLIPEAIYTGNSPHLEKTIADATSHMNALGAELDLETLYAKLLIKHSKSQQTLPKEFLESIRHNLDELLAKHDKVDTHYFLRMKYAILLALAELQNQSDKVIGLSDEAIRVFEAKPFDLINTCFAVELRKIAVSIKSGNYKIELQVYQKYQNTLRHGGGNWFLLQFYHSIASFYSKEYATSLRCIQESLNHRMYQELFPNRTQLWEVLEAFMHFLIECEMVPREAVEKYPLRPFKLYRFLNDVPIYAKDKRGINISLLVLHILFLLKQKKYDRIDDRTEALNQYCRRYLLRDDTFRANCFIKMLTQMPRAAYNRKRTERYAEKYVKQLATMPIEESRQSLETEPVPYEDLWEMVLVNLK